METEAESAVFKNQYEVAPQITGRRKANELNYLGSFVDLNEPSTAVIGTDSNNFYKNIGKNEIKNVLCLDSINSVRDLNTFIDKINDDLPYEGLFMGNVYPKEVRKNDLYNSIGFPLLFYTLYLFDYLWHRVCSKLKFTRPLYFAINKKSDRVISLAEVLGRVAAGGFKILDYKQFGKHVYFIAQKVKHPVFDEYSSSGAIFKMNRVGEGGKIVEFYKLRTMHTYSKYLQDFVYQKNGLKDGDKFNNDFRITTVGKFFRKYWLDELPMIYNLIKGDLKLVGVRPLSNHKFGLYTKELQDLRKKHKPGLIPPYYADMPGSLEEVMESEYRYLKSYERHPLRTDCKYFFKALRNIFINNARSH